MRIPTEVGDVYGDISAVHADPAAQDGRLLTIDLLGEFSGGRFLRGVGVPPEIGARCVSATAEDHERVYAPAAPCARVGALSNDHQRARPT